MQNKYLFILLTLICLRTSAQGVKTTYEELMEIAHHQPEVMSSVYRAYPTASDTYTAAPKGYEPVFISHYGRHGSRYLTEDERYKWIIEQMEGDSLSDGGKERLTTDGKELLKRIKIAWQQAEGRGGDLTAVGEQQHRGIAERMVQHFPTLFRGKNTLHAYSSTYSRCMMSMMAFCEPIKEFNPNLTIKRDVSAKNMRFISYAGPMTEASATEKALDGKKALLRIRKKLDKTESFISRIFVNPKETEDPRKFMEQTFFLAQDMQDCGRPTEMLSFFTPEELYAIWSAKNCEVYLLNGDSPLSHDIPALCSDSLLSHIVCDADTALKEHRSGATLRFGHDTALLKLLCRMNVEECCPATSNMDELSLVWQDYNITPMAANVQVIFYQNKKGHTLVRILLNENEVHLKGLASPAAPYYDWEEVKQYWMELKTN